MSSIDRLTLQGIRAFAPDQVEKIDFGQLTLIVGHNGSGKTTIIEALKYATTGIMPPGLQGPTQSTFLHDPNLDNEQSVSAQVKVRIRSTNGHRITATRRMDLVKKGQKFSFETKNGNIIMERNGDPLSHTATKTQLDQQIPAMLGVSPAVLDYVIFCHQDESLWPMSPARGLKEKFDKLFESDKWTKCGDQLKDINKGLKAKHELDKKDKAHYKTQKEQGAKCMRECTSLKEQVDALRAEVVTLSQQLDVAIANRTAAKQGADAASELVGRLDRARQEVRLKQTELNMTKSELEELVEDTPTLERMLATYDERMGQHRQESGERRVQYKQLVKSIEEADQALKAAEQELASCTAQQRLYEQQLDSRQSLIKLLADRHEIRGYTGALDDEQTRNFMQRLSSMIQDSKSATEAVKQTSRRDIQDLQMQIDDLLRQRTTQTNRKDNAKKEIEQNDNRIAKYQREHNDIDVEEGTCAAAQARLDDLQERLATAKSAAQTADYHGQEQLVEQDFMTVRKKKRDLEEELKKATDNMEESVQSDLLIAKIRDRKQSLEKMLLVHRSRLDKVLDHGWQPTSVKSHHNEALYAATSALHDCQKQRDDARRDFKQLDERLQACTSKISANEVAISNAAAKISQVVDGGPSRYYEDLASVEQARDIATRDASSYDVMVQWLDQAIKDASEKSACRLCTRHLRANDIEALKKHVEKEKRKLDVSSAKQDLQELETDMAQIKSVAAQQKLWERLSNDDQPALQRERSQLEQQRAEALRSLETYDSAVEDKQVVKREIDDVQQIVERIDSMQKDISESEKEKWALDAKISSTDSARDINLIRTDQSKIDQEETSLQIKLKDLRAEKEKSDKSINHLGLEVLEKQNKVSTLSNQLQSKVDKRNHIEECKASTISCKNTIQDCDRILESTALKLEATREKLSHVEKRGDTLFKERQEKEAVLRNSENELSLHQQQVQKHIDLDGPGQLKRAADDVRSMKESAFKLGKSKDEMTREIHAIDKQLENYEETRRNIDKNLSSRRLVEQLMELEKEILDLDSRDAQAELRQYNQAREDWSIKENSLQVLIGGKSEKMGALDGNLVTRLEEWEQNYKDADKNYLKAHINVEVSKQCMEDIARYATAMDKALMKFHSLKMDEINGIIDELWRKTYQGTDIDTIFIESDSESTTGSRSKSYNYRVCMKKMNTTMDMRGRCSAGQRVLACILIRLALAECFGTNCGLIALDEPTTNLDRENIISLAESLDKLMQHRKAQKNFQLIVITHDEDFLKSMRPAQYVDHYYRVSRTNRQKSQIKPEQISYLMRH